MSLVTKSAAELAALLDAGEVSSVEVTQAHLDRIAEVDGAVHAYLHVNESAIDTAAAIDKKRAEGIGYTYTVRSGDNLGSIAKRNRCSVKDIMRWNRLKSTVIRPGQKLRINKPKPRA